MSNSNYVNLQINGKLFPSWILLNFKKFQLPEYIQKEGEDPCKMTKTKKELRKYQEFLSNYLDYRSPYREILVYHGLGSGKTVTAINIYNLLYNYNSNWNVFLLIKASLKKDPWEKDLEEWLQSDDKKNRFANIKFIHYDSPYADKKFLEEVKQSDSSKKNIYIFDEAHNFIKNVYNNISTNEGTRAYFIYNYIKQQKMDDKSVRIILLSGTPAVNSPYELALIYNLLRPNSFPDKEIEFNELYLKGDRIRQEKLNMFQRRILGLTSYYAGATLDYFAKKNFYFSDIEMSKYQENIYNYYEDLETKLEKQSFKGSRTYKSFTRQSCNFVFPTISDKIKGDSRPRPSNFKISSSLANKILEERVDTNNKKNNIIEYIEVANVYIKEFKKYLKKISLEDEKNKKSILNDLKIYNEKYNKDFNKFYKEYTDKSLLLQKLYDCSCKVVAMIFKLIFSKGPCIIYSNYVKMEGLEIIKIYLEYLGFSDYNDDKKSNFTYTEYHGGIKNIEERENNRKNYNDKKNIKGDIIKVILISPAGSEGISLLNVREVHVLEPYWNEIRIEQLIGRAVRQCSHKDLPMEERFVDIYRYKSVKKNNELTTDQKIEKLSLEKKKLIDTFLKLVKQSAVDCELLKNVNMIEEKYQCFKFEEPKLFEKKIGPAYKEDYFIDKNNNNGLDSLNSIVKKIKVRKIFAVRDIGENKYTDKQVYWLNPDTNIIYDYDLKFAIGKILLTEYGIPNKIDRDTFVIDDIIDIPKLITN